MNAFVSRSLLVAFAAVSWFAASSASAQAQVAQVDMAKSTVTAVVTQMNVPVEGTFKKFSANINFDPAKLATSSARITVDVNSFDLGDPSYNEEVVGKDWFDAKRYPQATFESVAIAPVGAEQFNVKGNLTIKGKSQMRTISVKVLRQGATQIFEGSLPIKRLAFDIGAGAWKDTSVVADEVTIKFHIVNVKH